MWIFFRVLANGVHVINFKTWQLVTHKEKEIKNQVRFLGLKTEQNCFFFSLLFICQTLQRQRWRLHRQPSERGCWRYIIVTSHNSLGPSVFIYQKRRWGVRKKSFSHLCGLPPVEKKRKKSLWPSSCCWSLSHTVSQPSSWNTAR